jgi:hypothetical protein
VFQAFESQLMLTQFRHQSGVGVDRDARNVPRPGLGLDHSTNLLDRLVARYRLGKNGSDPFIHSLPLVGLLLGILPFADVDLLQLEGGQPHDGADQCHDDHL